MSFTKWQIASLRSSAKSYYTLINKKKKLEEKKATALAKIDAEINALEASIDIIETPVKTFFEGHSIEDLIVKVGEGPEAKYVLLYPETIVPTEVSLDTNVATKEEVSEESKENNNEDNNENIPF